MKAETVVMCFYFFISIACICFLAFYAKKPPPIHCNVAEISPDFSAEDKEYCRQLKHRQSSLKHYL